MTIAIKDANSTTIQILTFEESTSVHNNASVPINVSGTPMFTSAIPGIVCVAGTPRVSVDNLVAVSINGPLPAGTQHLGKVSVEGLTIGAGSGLTVSVGGPVSAQAVPMAGTDGSNYRLLKTHTDGALVVHISAGAAGGSGGDVSVSPTQGSIPVSIAGGSLSIADNAPVSVRGGRVSIADSTLAVTQSGTWNTNASVVGRVSVYPDGATNWPVSIAGTVNVSISPTQANINVNIAGALVSSMNDDNVAATNQGLYTKAFAHVFDGTTWDRWRGDVSVSPTQANIPVSLAPPTYNLPVSVHPVTQSGTWTVQPGNTANTTPWLVSVNGQVSLAAGVDKRVIGAVSVADATLAVTQSGTWNTNASVVGRVSVFVDQVPFNVSVNNVLPILVTVNGGFNLADNAPVSVRGGRVSIADSTLAVTQSGTWNVGALTSINSIVKVSIEGSLPGGTGTPQVSIGGAVSTQATQIAGTDGANARTFLTDTAGAIVITSIKDDVSIAPQTLLVHVCNSQPAATISKELVSIGGAVSTQAYPVAFTDGTDARIPYANAAGVQRVSVMDGTLAVTQSGTWNVGVNAGTNLIGAVSVRQIVSVVPDGTGANFPVSVAGTVQLAAGTNLIGAVSVRGNILGAVSISNIADVSVQDNAPVSVRGGVLGAVSLGGGTAHIGRVSVFVDQVPFNVSVLNTLPIPVSVIGGVVSVDGVVTVGAPTATGAAVPAGAHYVGGTDGTNLRGLLTDTTGAIVITSIKDDVSIASQTLITHVSNIVNVAQSGTWNIGALTSINSIVRVSIEGTLPGGSGSPQVSIGGPVSVQATQIAFTDGTNARTPLVNTGGNILVHVCNSLPTPPAADATQLVSIGGAVSTQAVQIAGRDTSGDARSPLMTTGGALIVHVSNTAPGGGGGGSYVSIGGAVSNQAIQVAGVDTAGNARTPLLDVSGTQKVGGFTTNPEFVFTRPTDTVSYAIGDLVANSTVAGTVVPMSWPVSRLTGGGGSIMIRRCRIITPNENRTTDRSYRLHLWNVASGLSVTNGDNGVFAPSLVSAYVGYLDIPMHLSAATGAAGVGAPGGGGDINIELAAGQVSISGFLEARTSIAPTTGQIFRVALELYQD